MNRYSRRQVLRFGGAGVAGVVLAACGKQANVPESENVVSVGVAPSKVTLPNVEVNDVVLLRTAASLEFNAIDTYEAALGLGVFTGAFAAAGDIAKRLRDDHKGHAEAINGLITKLGGTPFTCGNPRINEVYIAPALELITATDNENPALDVVVLAHALENLAAQTYQGVVTMLGDKALRQAAIGIGQDEARHAAVLAQALNPGLSGILPSVNPDTGKANVAAVPSAFGPLTPINVTVGPVQADGSRVSLILETPSLNSLAYDSVSCG
ncbi:MAG: ferritin-like domain-containing protein [Ilumatobacteraceae bacterium]|jgi:rubrerythrin|nr:ferritin-like domain-containing protein [Actinomycetota bacterium]NCV09156.1 ferritin-like domain-containing protein [Actinomycetota bacterium]NCZ87716.1 ferritin-like domain-containing protein [Actinomycetota bacterium]NDD62138.1 ferritin-like domain-containing protein [Actinomycetota bacterium]NDH92245.1 ferritin-like domain-containing protein [Actinomycetota bacterium]